MPQTHKVLGQVAPTATATLTTLYTVPASAQAVVSTFAAANLQSAATTFRLAVQPAGTAAASQHYLAYDVPLPGSDSVYLTLGVSLAATDVVSVATGSTNVAFSLFGVEIT